MACHKVKSCILLIFLQIIALQTKISLAHQAVMSPDNENRSESTTSKNDDDPPYTTTKQDGKLNVVFTSGPMQGDHFQVDIPQHIPAGQPQLEEEPPHPYSFFDGNGNELSEEEFERLSALEIAEEARQEQERRTAETEREN